MYTGLITDIARVRAIVPGGVTRIEVAFDHPIQGIDLGASIALSGPCFTATELGPDWLAVDASNETVARTTIAGWQVGTRVNFERSLRIGDELGGHLVSGHVDGIAEVADIRPDGDSHRFRFRLPRALGIFVAEKGSITVDGVSLTVNEVADDGDRTVFGVNIIPHTFAHTTFPDRKPGDPVNIEIDMVARYLRRWQDAVDAQAANS